jgi:signal transduction histidine kinase
VPDVRGATADELALAHIAGRLVLATLEQFFFVQQVRQTASAEERLRISRELHDGIVQSLAGVGLRLQSFRQRFANHGEAAEELSRVQSVLERDQRELRNIVHELRPHDTRQGETIVAEELQRMRERFPLEWGLEVNIEIAAPVLVPARIAHEVCRIVNESLSNAARHGGASSAIVSVAPRNGSVEIRVADNGTGFPFAGRHDLDALENAGHGPRTLKERVRNLGGSLLVDSSSSGASIEVCIPVGEAI